MKRAVLLITAIWVGIILNGREAFCGVIAAYGGQEGIIGMKTYDDEGNLISQSGVFGDVNAGAPASAPSSAPAAAAKPQHTHSYNEEITTEPTCTNPGEKTFTCSCGDTYTEAIDALGHDEDDVITTEPDCTQLGSIVVKCSKCGEIISQQELPALEHEAGTPERVEPTCVTDGTETIRCDRCGEVINENTLSALGHTEVVVETPARTFSDGLRTTSCTVCGEVLKEDTLPRAIPVWAVVGLLAVIVVIGGGVIVVKKRE